MLLIILTHGCFLGAVSLVEVMADVSKDSPINDGVFEHADESDMVVAVEWTDLSSSSGAPSSSRKSSLSLGKARSSRSS